MNKKKFICAALVVIALSIVFLPAAHASTVKNAYTPNTDMKIFNTFAVNIEPNADISIVYIDNSLSSDPASFIEQTTASIDSSIQYVGDPTIVPQTCPIDTLTMSDPISLRASIFNVTIFNFDYSIGGSVGQVTAIRFEVSKEDHKMIAISAFSEQDVTLLLAVVSKFGN